MKRQYSGRGDALVKSAEGEQGFWPSYADMMSAVALILFFLSYIFRSGEEQDSYYRTFLFFNASDLTLTY